MIEASPHKIAYVIDDLSIGGAQKQLSLLARELPNRRFVPIVFALSENLHPFAAVLEGDGVEVISIPRRSHNDVVRLLTLRRLLARADIDLLHGFLDASNAYAFLAARMLHKPVVLGVQSDRLRLSGVKSWSLSWMLRR